MKIRNMIPNDYDSMMTLWTSSPDIGVNPDDNKVYIEKFLARNPYTSFVAVENDEIIGTVMAGHDGYRGYIHHTCVSDNFRRNGIGALLVKAAVDALKAEGINKVFLVVFKTNENGNAFWEKQGFKIREDLYYRDLRLNG
ncbi:MAG: GNAT family N-acetyltransferase [Clostridia bacterium]|nr:GNAT family N-acetyltransferase [Clostridia bacterium]